MKNDKLRRNVDLKRETIIILQWQAVVSGHGTIKPYLEKYIEEHAVRIAKRNPSIGKLLTKVRR